MIRLHDPEQKAAWARLAEMYRWLYGMSLQERLAEQRFDVADWWWIGGKLELLSPTAPPPRQRDPNAGAHTPVWPAGGSRRLEPRPAPETLPQPEPPRETLLGSPLAGRPDAVKEIVMCASVQTGVSVARIMGRRRRWAEVQARHLVIRRLAAMPWCGARPSHEQIAQWMGLERTTVLHALGKIVRPGA